MWKLLNLPKLISNELEKWKKVVNGSFSFSLHPCFRLFFSHFRLFTAVVDVSTMQLNFHNEKPETFWKDYFPSFPSPHYNPAHLRQAERIFSFLFFPACPFQCSLKSFWCIKETERFFASFDHTKNVSIIPNKRRDFPIEKMQHNFKRWRKLMEFLGQEKSISGQLVKLGSVAAILSSWFLRSKHFCTFWRLPTYRNWISSLLKYQLHVLNSSVMRWSIRLNPIMFRREM